VSFSITTAKTAATINFVTSVPTSNTIVVDGKSFTSSGTTHQLVVSNLTPNTQYEVSISSEGLPSNAVFAQPCSRVDVFTTVASDPVSITNMQLIACTPYASSFTLTVDVPSTVVIQYGTSNNDLSMQSPSTSADQLSHTFNLANLTPNTTYYYKFEATPLSNTYDVTSTTLSSFATLNIQPVSIVNVFANKTTATCLVTFQTNTQCSTKLFYGTASADSEVVGTSADGLTHTVSLVGLQKNTLYTYYVKVTPSSGLFSETTSMTSNFTTLDSMPVTISGVDVLSTPSSCFISFETNTSGVATLFYGNGNVNTPIACISADGLDHTVSILGLNPSLTYSYKIKVVPVDSNFHATETSIMHFTTSSAPPVDITDISYALGITSSVITYKTNTVCSTKVFYGLSGIEVLSTSSDGLNHTITIAGLIKNTEYPFYIRVIPASNLFNDTERSILNFRTLDAPFVQINNLVVTPNNTTCNFSLTTSVASTVKIFYGAGNYSLSANFTTSNNLSHTLTVAGLPADTTYNYRIEVTPLNLIVNNSSQITNTFKTPNPVTILSCTIRSYIQIVANGAIGFGYTINLAVNVPCTAAVAGIGITGLPSNGTSAGNQVANAYTHTFSQAGVNLYYTNLTDPPVPGIVTYSNTPCTVTVTPIDTAYGVSVITVSPTY
jgi:hypothetical protein